MCLTAEFHRPPSKKQRRAFDAADQVDMPAPVGPMTPTSEDGGAKVEQPQPPSRRPCTVPEKGSLWDLMHDHQGTSLFVLPLCWTDLHTRLLRCRFVQRPPQKTPTPSTSLSPTRSLRTSSTVIAMGRDLDILMSRENPRSSMIKIKALRNVLSTLFPKHLCKPKSNADLNLRFGNRLYTKATKAQVLWKHPDASMSFDSATTWTSSHSTQQLMASMSVNVAGDAPVLAYVSRSNLNHIRHNCFRVVMGPNRAYNGPVHRLQTLRSKLLIPSNLDEDPHFVASIIALAQQTAYPEGLRVSKMPPKDVTVRLFTTSEEDEAFIVYTATVPAAFLMMFHQPDKAPKSNAEVKIDYTHVPVWPVLGLKERLGQALSREVVGDFDPYNIETFPDEEKEIMNVAEVTSPKRRRGVLSEVLNVSFSEDREPVSDEINVMGKRRCLEGRIGVVR
jgi:hypothetical protein